MAVRNLLIAFSVFTAAVANDANLDSVLDQGAGNTVQKVIKLLNEMKDQLEKEAAEDQAMYDKLVCWCETNEKEKTKAIEVANSRITDLMTNSQEFIAKAAQLEVDIAQQKKEVAQNTKALGEATGIRAKELEEFRNDEKDMISSISSLSRAVETLGSQHSAALNQQYMKQISQMMNHHMKRFPQLMKQAILPHQRKHVTAFVQNAAAYDPASGQIFGILKGMKETFETNLASSQQEEKEAVATFTELKTAKSSELAAGKKKIDTFTIELADNQEKAATAKEDLADTRKALSADTKFLGDLKLKCQVTDQEWDARAKVRQEEIAAVAETISILTSDDALDLTRKTVSFVQVHLSSVDAKRKEATQFLLEAGKKLQSPRLRMVAMQVQMDPFSAMKEEIDKLVAGLSKEKQDEINHRDFCIAELNQNEKQTAAKMDMKQDLETKIADLSATMDTLTEEVNTIQEEMAATQVEMKKASQIREAENKDFQTTVTEQRATQALLQKALDRLKAFYDKKAAALLQAKQDAEDDQEPGAEAPPMPEALPEYKKNAGSSGVMVMIGQVIEDSKKVEADATAAENYAQASYESFIKNANGSLAAASKEMTAKSESKAQAESDKTAAEGDLKHTINDLLTLGEYLESLHGQCDFTIKNFDVRQSSRDQEIDALKQAKMIFSGAKFLQMQKK